MAAPRAIPAVCVGKGTPICELFIDKPPACIKFVPPAAGKPHQNLEDYFVVGTYQLVENAPLAETPAADEDDDEHNNEPSSPAMQSRIGSLILCKYKNSRLTQMYAIEFACGIYDFHFLDTVQPAVFVVASSTGTISFYKVDIKDDALTGIATARILLLKEHQVFDSTTIITYLDTWTAREGDRDVLIVAATTDQGGVYLMRFHMISFAFEWLREGTPITRHMLGPAGFCEAWCCALVGDMDVTLFSGADNHHLVQVPLSGHEFLKVPGLQLSASSLHMYHDAGVLAILPLPAIARNRHTLVLTGSYDEHLRLYDTESKTEILKSNLGGGVYRLKFLQNYSAELPSVPSCESYLVMACCMHGGVKIVQVQGNRAAAKWRITVVASPNLLGSVPDNYAYASDVQPLRAADVKPVRTLVLNDSLKRVCVSGTWLDRKLTAWEFDPMPPYLENS